jgi:transcriptional regulator with XRE-family HTH domain
MNDTNVTERIKELIEREGHTVSSFATEIKVIRSTVSHIISGRNKPSLEFVQKLLLRYPEIDPAWLLFGRDVPFKSKETAASASLLSRMKEEEADDIDSEDSNIAKTTKKEGVTTDYLANSNENKSASAQESKASQSIEQIIFFYKDGSFKVYKQEA